MDRYCFDVMAADTDYSDRLHMHSLFAMIQEAAARNAEEHGWGATLMDQKGAAWVILRMSLRMKRRPVLGESVLIETWSRGFRRLYFMRDFLIFDEKNEIIGRATSLRLAVNKDSRRPLRPDYFGDISSACSVDKAVLFEMPPELDPIENRLTTDDSELHRITKYADFSEIDRNMHVNNTRYIAWSMDAANYIELVKYDILSVDINYLCEIRHKEKVDIVFSTEGTDIWVNGIVTHTGKLAFCCRLGSDGDVGGNQ